MTTFAVTGATGLVGENLLYEILKQNRGCLDSIKIICFGRPRNETSLEQRLRDSLNAQGWQYFGSEHSEALVDELMDALVPVHISFAEDGLALSTADQELLSKTKIDHLFHVAALTDFRKKDYVAKRLDQVNAKGTVRLLELVDSLSQPLESFAFVGSAYSCGRTYGAIAPDYINFDQDLRNPYQHSKLVAECVVREHFRASKTKLRVFRPSTCSGRRIENPMGYVNKYDVFLGWALPFIKAKMSALPGASWSEVVATPIDMPARIHANPAIGLNIVPSDFCGKVMVAAAVGEHPATNYHLVSRTDLNCSILFHRIMERLNIRGITVTPDPVTEFENELEATYYRTAGDLYTAYLDGDAPMEFDATSMLDVCNTSHLDVVGIESSDDLDLMLDFAIDTQWGLDVGGAWSNEGSTSEERGAMRTRRRRSAEQ